MTHTSEWLRGYWTGTAVQFVVSVIVMAYQALRRTR